MFKHIKRFWTQSIQRQLILGIALVHAVLMTIFVFDLVSRQLHFLHQQSVSQAISLTETLAVNSSSWVLANDIIGMEELIHAQKKYPDLLYAMLISLEGEVLAHTDSSNMGLHVSDPVSMKILNSTPQLMILIENQKQVDVAVPVLANNVHIAWARIGLGQERIIAGLDIITRDGIIYTILAIIVGIFFAYFMAKGLTLSLRHLVEITHRIRAGERSIRSDIERHDEIGELSQDINKMLDGLIDNENALRETQEELTKSEERFELAMLGANDGLWDWDASTDEVFYSQRWKEMLGYDEDEISNKEHEWQSRVHPEDLESAQAAIEAHIRGETPSYENVHRIMHRDGRYRWHLERGIAVRDKQGNVTRMVGTNTDITDRKQAQEKLYEEKERILVTLNSIGDAVITTDEQGLITFMNPVAEELTGWETSEVSQQPVENIFKIIDESSHAPSENPVKDCLDEGRIIALTVNIFLVNRKNKRIPIENSVAPIRDRRSQIIGVIIVFHDVTHSREMTQQLNWQATHDALTGLYNRTYFERKLSEALKLSESEKLKHALLYIDLDQFKIVNDTCGHKAGDELLTQLTFILENHIRSSDIFARLGGDEFGLLLMNCPIEKAKDIADNIRQLIKEFRFSWEEKNFEIGASIGLVEISEDSESLAAVLSAADVACYAAKDMGRDRVHVYEQENEDLQQRRGEMQWVSQINDAITNDRLVLFCQPICNTRAENDLEEHYEILIRMLDDKEQLIFPGVFIPAAERFDLMSKIDRWVIKKLFSQIAKHMNLHGSAPKYGFAINISGNSFNDENFLGYVAEMFGLYGIPHSMICFEITETAAITNLSKAHRFMRIMGKLGCKFSLDDFGSGLSSFAYLKNLPVDYLKIDGAFVKDLLDDPIDRAMVKSIHDIGHVMGIKTIAEFVENQEIREQLALIGVDYVQGYGIEKPCKLEDKHFL